MTRRIKRTAWSTRARRLVLLGVLMVSAVAGGVAVCRRSAAPAPPAPSITGHPASLTNLVAASFSFTDSQAGVTFLCKLDAAAVAACTSPKTYTVAAGEPHVPGAGDRRQQDELGDVVHSGRSTRPRRGHGLVPGQRRPLRRGRAGTPAARRRRRSAAARPTRAASPRARSRSCRSRREVLERLELQLGQRGVQHGDRDRRLGHDLHRPLPARGSAVRLLCAACPRDRQRRQHDAGRLAGDGQLLDRLDAAAGAVDHRRTRRARPPRRARASPSPTARRA